MIRGLRLLPLLLVSLALSARSQERPPVERTDAIARELAADVKRSPTRPDNLQERMERLMHFAMSSGRPERYLRKDKVHHIQKVAGAGRLKKAARLVDDLYHEAGSAGEREPMPPEPPRDLPLGERPIVGPGHDTPLMLSVPQLARPVLTPFAAATAMPMEAPAPADSDRSRADPARGRPGPGRNMERSTKAGDHGNQAVADR